MKQLISNGDVVIPDGEQLNRCEDLPGSISGSRHVSHGHQNVYVCSARLPAVAAHMQRAAARQAATSSTLPAALFHQQLLVYTVSEAA
jgi:hypothetical protein